MRRLPRGHLRSLIWLYSVSCTSIFIVLGLVTAWAISEVREARVRESQARAHDIAGIFSEHLERLFASLEWMSDAAAVAYAQHAQDSQSLVARLAEINSRERFSLQLSIVDPKGIFIASNVSAVGGADLRDRDHIRVHLEGDGPRFYVSKPLIGRVSGQHSINITRGILDGSGATKCIVVVSFDPLMLNNFFEKNDFGADGVIALARLDGTLLGRSKGAANLIGSDLSRGDIFTSAISKGATSGSMVARSLLDGLERYYSFKRLDPFGLVFIVGTGTEAAVAGLGIISQIAAIWMFLLAVVFLLGGLVLRKFISQQAAFVEASIREREAKSLAELLEGAFHRGGVLVIVFNETGTVTFMNKPVQSLAARLRCDSKDLLGRLIGKGIENEGSAQTKLTRRVAVSGSEELSVFWTIAPASWISASARIAIGFDRTEVEASERVLYQRARLTMLGEMATGLAHEMAQPLTVINFASKMVANSKDESIKEALQLLTAASDRVAKTVENMKVFGRRGDGNAAKRFKLADSIASVELLTRNELALSNISLAVVEVSDELIAVGDSGLFVQVLLNLVMNARDAIKGFTCSGGGRLAEIKISGGLIDNGKVFVCVSDTGGGIPEEVGSRIFEPFYTTKSSGSGLGLSLSFGIVSDMGGSISFSSSSQGTEFRVVLPSG